MKYRLFLLTALLPLVFAGCAMQQKTPGATFDRIGGELSTAVNAKSKTMDDALSQAMLPPLQLDLPDSAKSVEPRFDLAVSNAPATQVLMALVSGTRYSMLVAPEVSGNITANLKSVTVREALETLRELYGYEFKFQGTRIYIQPNTMQTRIFQINYMAGKRKGQSDVRVTSSSISSAQPQTAGSTTSAAGSTVAPTGAGNPSGPPSSQISTTQSSDFWRDLTSALTSIVGTQDGRAVIVSPGSGVVLVKAFPADIRSVENYLRITQVIVERQVMLEAKEIGTRFDFKGTSAAVELKDKEITLFGDAEFQLTQVEDLLRNKLTKRNVDVRFLDMGDVQKMGGDKVKQVIKVRNGIESELAKKLQKLMKESKLKVQAAIQEDKVRITGAKRDDLQAAMALIRKDVTDIPLSFDNFRD